MANNYNQNIGTKWTRCKSIFISNSLNYSNAVNFGEELILRIPGEDDITLPKVGNITMLLEQPTYELYDPITGDLTVETITSNRLNKILYSLYLKTAKTRDLAMP